jgi:phosphoadenosine phosphosulfate reductase
VTATAAAERGVPSETGANGAGLPQARVESALAVLRAAAANAPAAFSTSFGAEDMVVLDLICENRLPIEVFTLDTGRLPEETYALMQRVEQRYGETTRETSGETSGETTGETIGVRGAERSGNLSGNLSDNLSDNRSGNRSDNRSGESQGLRLRTFYPDAESVSDLVARNGINGFFESVDKRRACCAVRKVEPLRRALAGKRSWVTGLRAGQSAARAQVGARAFDAEHGLEKFSPLHDWTEAEVWSYLRSREVPYNALHDRFYPSIGCAPCTRAVTPGEDPRSGRWWWEQGDAKECGLHPVARGATEAVNAPARGRDSEGNPQADRQVDRREIRQ